MNVPIALTAALVFSAVVFGTLALALIWEVVGDWLTRRRVSKRLRPVLSGEEDTSGRFDDLVRQFDGSESLMSQLADALPGVRRTEHLIQEAQVEWKPETFLLISTGLAAGLGAASYLVAGALPVSIVAAAIGASAPYLYLRRKRKLRLDRFEEEFPEAIDLLTRAIRAGHPLASGMRMVSQEGPPTVAKEFGQTFEEQRFGLPFNDALLGMVDRVGLLDVRIFAIAVLIQREVGGNLAEILDNLAQTIRARFYIRRQLRTYTAQGRLSGYALTIMPVAVGLILYAMEPDHVGLLFASTLGWFMVIAALVLQIIGGLWIRKIINIDI